MLYVFLLCIKMKKKYHVVGDNTIFTHSSEIACKKHIFSLDLVLFVYFPFVSIFYFIFLFLDALTLLAIERIRAVYLDVNFMLFFFYLFTKNQNFSLHMF